MYSPQELKLASFRELASVNKLAEGLNASFLLRPFFWGYTSYFRQTLISIREVKQTVTTGVHESLWNSCEKHERKTRVENACELVYARKLVKACVLQFLGGLPLYGSSKNLLEIMPVDFYIQIIKKFYWKIYISKLCWSFLSCTKTTRAN